MTDAPIAQPVCTDANQQKYDDVMKLIKYYNTVCPTNPVTNAMLTCSNITENAFQINTDGCKPMTVKIESGTDIFHEFVRLYNILFRTDHGFFNIYRKEFLPGDIYETVGAGRAPVKEHFTLFSKEQATYVNSHYSHHGTYIEMFDPFKFQIYYIRRTIGTIQTEEHTTNLFNIRAPPKILNVPLEIGDVVIKLKRQGDTTYQVPTHITNYVNKQRRLYKLMDTGLDIIRQCINASFTYATIYTTTGSETHATEQRYRAIVKAMPFNTLKINLASINNIYEHGMQVNEADRTITLCIKSPQEYSYAVDNVPLFFLDADCSFYEDIHTVISYEVSKNHLYHYLCIQHQFKPQLLQQLVYILNSDSDRKKPITLQLCGIGLGGVMVNLLAFELKEILKTKINYELDQLDLTIKIITVNCPKMFYDNEKGQATLNAFNTVNPNNICLYTTANYNRLKSIGSEHMVPGCYAVMNHAEALNSLNEYIGVIDIRRNKSGIKLCQIGKTWSELELKPYHYKIAKDKDAETATPTVITTPAPEQYNQLKQIEEYINPYATDKWYYCLLALAYRRCRDKLDRFLIDAIRVDNIMQFYNTTVFFPIQRDDGDISREAIRLTLGIRHVMRTDNIVHVVNAATAETRNTPFNEFLGQYPSTAPLSTAPLSIAPSGPSPAWATSLVQTLSRSSSSSMSSLSELTIIGTQSVRIGHPVKTVTIPIIDTLHNACKNILVFTKEGTLYFCVGDIDINAKIGNTTPSPRESTPQFVKTMVTDMLKFAMSTFYEKLKQKSGVKAPVLVVVGVLYGGEILCDPEFKRLIRDAIRWKIRYYTFNTCFQFRDGPEYALHFRMNGADFKQRFLTQELKTGIEITLDASEESDGNDSENVDNILGQATNLFTGVMQNVGTNVSGTSSYDDQIVGITDFAGAGIQTATTMLLTKVLDATGNHTASGVVNVLGGIDIYGIVHSFGGDRLLLEAVMQSVSEGAASALGTALPFVGVAYSLLKAIYLLTKFLVERHRMLKEKTSMDYLIANLKISMVEKKGVVGGKRIKKNTKKQQHHHLVTRTRNFNRKRQQRITKKQKRRF